MSMKGAHKHNTEQDKEPPMNEISAKTIKENLQKSTGQDTISVLSHVHVKHLADLCTQSSKMTNLLRKLLGYA